MPIESAITEKNSEDEFQHVEITPSKKANVSTENFGNQYKQPAMGFETDVDSFQQSMIYQAVEENWIRISFHALIAPNMKFEHQNDIVVLHMWTKNGNGGTVNWKKPMTFEGTHLEVQGVAEVKFEVDLPKSDVFNARISYKYFVERNSEKHDGTKRKSVWECLYGNKSDNDRRQLHVDKSSEGLGYWHQYDGFIYKKTKPKKPKEAGGIIKSLKSGYEYVIGTNVTERDKDPEIVLRVFGGQIANMWSKMYQMPHLIDMMKNMSYQLLICTENIYSFGKNWRTIRQQVNQTLWKTFTDCYKSLQDGSSDEDIKRKTCLSIVMLYIRQLTCAKTDEQALQFLCSCFLVHSDGSKKRVREYDVLLQHFSNKERDELKNELVLFVFEMTSQVSKDPSWWYLLPVLHFLSGTCAPFEEVSLNVNHAAVKPYWWGLMITEDFEKIKNRFMFNQHRPKIPPQTIIRKMRGLFTADYYLPRSIVASLTLNEIRELIKDTTMIPHEVFFAAMYFFMVSERETSTKVTKCLDELLNQVQFQEMESDCKRLHMKVSIAKDMLIVALSTPGIDKWLQTEYGIKIYLYCMAFYDKAVLDRTGIDEIESLPISLEEIVSLVIHELDTRKMYTFGRQIDLWDRMLYPGNFPDGDVKKRWNKTLCEALEGRMEEMLKQSKTGGHEIVSCYCRNINSYQQPMQKFMASYVSKVLGSTSCLVMKNLSETERYQLRQLMLRTFNAQWQNVCNRHDGKMDLKVLCNWANLPLFLSILDPYDINEQQDRDILTNITNVLESSAERIISGSILIGEMTFVLENTKRFLDLLEFTKFKDNPSVAKAISVRLREKCLLNDTLDDLQNLKSFCSSLEAVDLKELDEQLKANLTESKLSDVIVVAPIQTFSDENSEIKLVRFEVNKDIRKALTCLHRYKESLFFKKLWERECSKQEHEKVLTLTDIYQAVVVPVLERMRRISLDIVHNTISFTELETEIGMLYPNNFENLQTELATICDQADVSKIQILVRQIKNYRHVVFMRKVAMTLMIIKDTYDLHGDFGSTEDICKIELDKLDVATLTDDFYEKCSLLADITQEQHACLQAFSKCSDLVVWLRKSMGDSQLKELKVFVDLAMMSAGDNVEKAERVQCLHAAVTGYSSLIFDLQNEGGIMHLLQMCQPVWKELSNMENIHNKLEDASRYIEWFKNIKSTHGAVEVTSFMQAETINEHGVYMIGKSVHERFDGDVDQNISRDDDKEHLLGLLIPASLDGHRDAKQYRFSELQDLQSRLMLVGGESEQIKHCIDRFSVIFDGVIRLCNIYKKLVSSGCVLFKDFSIQVYSNPSPERPVCFVLEFRNGTQLTQLKCHKTVDELIENMMPKVATEMENCLSEWLNFVNSKRTDFPQLNFYTTDQLVILQKEIAHIMNNGEPSSDLYPLLHLRKNQCTLDDIETTNRKTTDKIQREDLLKNEDEEAPENAKKAKSSEAKETFIQKLIKAGCRDMLPYALDEFRNNLKPSSAIAWCLRNRSRIHELKETYRAKQLEKGMTDKYDMDTSYDAMIASAVPSDSNTVRCDEMLKKLVLIWKKFLESASSNLRDYISLKHLGIFLELLGTKEDESFQRRLPPNYNTEAPNLIICPSHELLQATVSLYMTDQNQMLPQADEVVTCSLSTTFEEVDIFLRRAIFSSNGKIHCLVHADLLGYYVWEEIEKRLAEYLRNKDSTARIGLVIICSSENEHTSAVVSSLDRYKREYKPLNDAFVSSCIAEKLKFSGSKSASAVDLQSSTVRVIRSKRSGVGKTLYKKRKEETLKRMMKTEESLSVTLSLHGKHIDVDKIIGLLRPHARLPGQESPRIIHIDVANEVYAKQELDYMLFNLMILGRVVTSTGLVWKKNHLDLYLIERLEMISPEEIPENACQIFRFLPYVTCLSPQDCLDVYEGKITPDPNVDDQLFDQMLFESDLYQKTYIYLKQLERGVKNINIRSSFRAASPSKSECLKTLLRQCRVKHPSWSELYHFVLFLRTQLRDFERNVFVSDVLAKELPGFSTFVLKFLLQMSQDFSSRSLNMSEENAGEVKSDEDLLKAFKMRRTWESSPHPYIFFNADGQTFTFLGFYIDPETMDLIDQQTNEPLERAIMHHRLYDALLNNQVPIQENFDHLDRSERIERLCRVMDMPIPETDPDETYELTTDNAKKIMAIYMRFRCDIPVIVMGETGCGKTRLVKFMCDLMNQKQDGSTNMIIMKVHGGTTDDDIKAKVKEAENIARENRKRGIVDVVEEESSIKNGHCENIDGDMNMMLVVDVPRASEKKESVHVSSTREKINRNVYTVLFFDEANTTESIGLIKEIMCDKTMDGKPLNLCENLKIVAACNPYRRHPKKLIKKLERAGLGYANPGKTTDVLGRIAMRQLVYRVQPLPPSLLPFVWDFGQLNASVEKLYIVQMVKRYIRQNALPDNQKLTEVISTILAQSQEYMRGVEDECCFVSLRDVDRVLKVMCWFLSLYNRRSQLFIFMKKKLSRVYQNVSQDRKLDKITRCLVLALGVCYHASLTDRDKYRKHIANYFREPCLLPLGPEQILHEID
ncbi:E3 ubiquitin-protein ligase rnf213-alpha-like, partial [Mercenaria mercenaria]|uniref:E3 ubiquitin-protein ligase rnf213-alpha-like n=1 Tax=Mercenaria mercenaria TaxID=6596 RepID=UPI00234F461E